MSNNRKVKKNERYYKSLSKDIYQRLSSYPEDGYVNAKKLGHLSFDNISSAKAEIYKIFDFIKKVKHKEARCSLNLLRTRDLHSYGYGEY